MPSDATYNRKYKYYNQVACKSN